MTTNDPRDPAYGWGDGSSALARGEAAFETPAEAPAQVLTEPGISRRKRRSERQELGFVIDSTAGYRPAEPMAAIEPGASEHSNRRNAQRGQSVD